MSKFNKDVLKVIEEIIGLDMRKDTGKVRVREYSGGEERCIGQGCTLGEALAVQKGDHWIDSQDDQGALGFIYRVIDTKEKKSYIGRKQYKYFDKNSNAYSIRSMWEEYTGSCKPLTEAYESRPEDFIFYKLLECDNREELGYAEHMLIRRVIENTLVTGESEYYNGVIPKLYLIQIKSVTKSFKDKVEILAEGL